MLVTLHKAGKACNVHCVHCKLFLTLELYRPIRKLRRNWSFTNTLLTYFLRTCDAEKFGTFLKTPELTSEWRPSFRNRNQCCPTTTGSQCYKTFRFVADRGTNKISVPSLESLQTSLLFAIEATFRMLPSSLPKNVCQGQMFFLDLFHCYRRRSKVL